MFWQNMWLIMSLINEHQRSIRLPKRLTSGGNRSATSVLTLNGKQKFVWENVTSVGRIDAFAFFFVVLTRTVFLSSTENLPSGFGTSYLSKIIKKDFNREYSNKITPTTTSPSLAAGPSRTTPSPTTTPSTTTSTKRCWTISRTLFCSR